MDYKIFLYFDLTGKPEKVFNSWWEASEYANTIRPDMIDCYDLVYFTGPFAMFKEIYLMWRYPHLKLK